MNTWRYVVIVAIACLPAPAAVAEDDARPAAALQDNSFLIEEAYNQEPGVVQHILSLRRQGRDWSLGFTQEWPILSQTHQFSYTIPYAWLREGGQRATGIGDAMLNYRFQLLKEGAWLPTFAPRISLILPTGNQQRGLGTGSIGYQINLPFSKMVSDRVTLHFNAGLTSFHDVYGRTPTSYNLGASAVFAVTREFNLMFEAIGEWTATATPNGLVERQFATTLSPGLRYAFNLDAGQLVVGAATPVRFTSSKPSYGVFGYLSFEHRFLNPEPKPLLKR